MSDNKILDALRKLDVKNDNHWTAQGEPRIDTVKFNVGDGNVDVTRDSINAAAPNFSRSTAEGYKTEGEQSAGDQGGDQPEIVVTPPATAEGSAPPPPPPLPSAPPADGSPMVADPAAREGSEQMNGAQNAEQASDQKGGNGQMPPEIAQGVTEQGENKLATPESDLADAQASTAPSPNAPESLGGPVADDSRGRAADPASGEGEAQLNPLDHGRDGDPDAVAALEKELASAEADSEKLRGQVDNYQGKLTESTRREAAIRDAIAAVTPRSSQAKTVQDYFARQDEENARQAAIRQALRDSGLDLSEVAKIMGQSPIDKATSEANGRQ